MRKLLGAFALLMVVATAVSAATPLVSPCSTVRCVNAPEIDPASAIAGFTLLLGGIAVIRGRKRR